MSDTQTVASSEVKSVSMAELLKGKKPPTIPPPASFPQPTSTPPPTTKTITPPPTTVKPMSIPTPFVAQKPPATTPSPVASTTSSKTNQLPLPSTPKNETQSSSTPPANPPPVSQPTNPNPLPPASQQPPPVQTPPLPSSTTSVLSTAHTVLNSTAPSTPPPMTPPPATPNLGVTTLSVGVRQVYGLTKDGTVRKASREAALKALVREETVPEVITIYGDKGDGKTYFALSIPGTIVALQFDKKTSIIWKTDYHSDPRIRVFDATMLEAYSDGSVFQESSIENFKLINYIFDLIEESPPDWIFVDGLERLSEICEQMMRARNNFKPFQGVEWTYWKERRIYLRQIHSRISRIAKCGVLYSTYVETKELMKDGKVNDSKEIPKYIDMVLQETDDVIRLYSDNDKRTNTIRFNAFIESSKGTFKVGERKEVTGKGFMAFPETAKIAPKPLPQTEASQ